MVYGVMLCPPKEPHPLSPRGVYRANPQLLVAGTPPSQKSIPTCPSCSMKHFQMINRHLENLSLLQLRRALCVYKKRMKTPHHCPGSQSSVSTLQPPQGSHSIPTLPPSAAGILRLRLCPHGTASLQLLSISPF